MDGRYWNPEVRAELFSYLSLDSLKTARLVCKSWNFEAARALSNKVIVQHGPSSLVSLERLTSFLISYHIKHVLKVSLLPKISWLLDTNCDWDKPKLLRAYEQQRNSILYHDYITKSFLTPLAYTSVVTELYINFVLMDKSDSNLLMNILARTRSLRRLALLFVNSSNDGVQNLSLDACLPVGLQSLGFIVRGTRDDPEQHWGIPDLQDGIDPPDTHTQWNLKSYMHFLKLFHRIQFLDLTSYSQQYGHEDDLNAKRMLCLKALNIICSQDQHAFPNLEGLRIDLCQWVSLIPFPKPMKLLSIRSNVYYDHHFKTQQPALSKYLAVHAPTLTTCQLFLYTYHRYFQNHLPPLPFLQNLSILHRSFINFPKRPDAMNLRSLFLGGVAGFSAIVPSLKSLTVLTLPFENDSLEYREIFPNQDATGMAIKILQLKYLVISLSCDCNSPEVVRILGIFPNLQFFRHLRPAQSKDSFVICDHLRGNNKSILPELGLPGKILQDDPGMLSSYVAMRLSQHEDSFFYNSVKETKEPHKNT